MASLRLTFPEKDQPTVIALTGARLTIGRLPFNTIQIIDRTVSGFHAELISEHGHYRLHDRGSSNGTFVNGQKIADFHLNDACTITFGTVEAQFSPEDVAVSEEAESFPTRNEINGVRRENAELRGTVEALREEAVALRQARPLENGAADLAVTKEEFDKVVVEREKLKEARLKLEEELELLKADLSVLKRDRVNLQLAYDGVQRELQELRQKAGVVDGVALAPKAAAAALAAQAPAPDVTMRIEVPVLVAAANSSPAAPAEAEEPRKAEAEAVEAPAPAPVPAKPAFAPLPPKAPNLPAKPFAPLPKAPTVAATVMSKPVAVPSSTSPKAPVGLGSGIRPLSKPPVAVATPADGNNQSASLPNVPTARLAPRPLPTAKLPAQPTVKLSAVPAPQTGPKGTQKLSE
jgi:pSer/pThr/pTyr-binding forkhead associated (FHA) protein